MLDLMNFQGDTKDRFATFTRDSNVPGGDIQLGAFLVLGTAGCKQTPLVRVSQFLEHKLLPTCASRCSGVTLVPPTVQKVQDNDHHITKAF